MLDGGKDSTKLEAMKIIVGVRGHYTTTNHHTPVLSDNNPQCLFFPTGVFSAFILCIVLTTEYSYVTSGLQMVAKGRDCTNLFPAVVKNVVSKNAEVLAAALGSSC